MALTPVPGFIEYFTDRDSWFVKQQTKIVLVVLGLFFVSMVMSCQELRYMVSGKTTDANITTRVETISVRGTQVTHLVIGLSYDDGGTNRQEFVTKPLDWEGATSKTAKVQYIPGHDRVRLVGDSNKLWVFVFFGSLALAVMGGIILVKSG